MKNQPSKDGKRKNFNQKKRLGGMGLSLEAFANAKSKIDGYNPSLIKVYEKKHEEEEKESMLQARNKERELVESKRKERRENMFKRTRSRQPIMKYRIEQILQTLQDSAK
ncbi:hypothetical protein MKX01_016261 [Papaver californicum]|nr:hypothetical protein MKX01_016261 [Papaver californicum]